MARHLIQVHRPQPPAKEKYVPKIKAGPEIVTMNRNRTFTDRKKEQSRRFCRETSNNE